MANSELAFEDRNKIDLYQNIFDAKRIKVNSITGHLLEFELPTVDINLVDSEIAKAVQMIGNVMSGQIGSIVGADVASAIPIRKYGGNEPIEFSASLMIHAYDKRGSSYKDALNVIKNMLPEKSPGTVSDFLGFVTSPQGAGSIDYRELTGAQVDLFKSMNANIIEDPSGYFTNLGKNLLNTVKKAVNPFELKIYGSSTIAIEVGNRRIVNIPYMTQLAEAFVIKNMTVEASPTMIVVKNEDGKPEVRPLWIKLKFGFSSLSVVTATAFTSFFGGLTSSNIKGNLNGI